MFPIQYTKNKNGMASLFYAIRKILEKYNALGQYRILFVTCSCKEVDRKERKKLMIKHRKKQIALLAKVNLKGRLLVKVH